MARLTIMMHRDLDTGQWYVERVEIERNKIRTQTRFGTPYPVGMAFNQEFADYLLTILPDRTDPSALVIAEKDFPGLAVAFTNLKVIAQRAFAGLQYVSIRVNDAVGNLSRIYSPKLVLDASPEAPRALTDRS